MKIITFTKTGKITRVVDYPENACLYDDLIQMYPDEIFMAAGAHVSDVTHYVVDGEVSLRPSMSSMKLIGKTLCGVPVGATLGIEGREYVADGSDVELEFDLPGIYPISVTLWPYLDAEIVYESQP